MPSAKESDDGRLWAKLVSGKPGRQRQDTERTLTSPSSASVRGQFAFGRYRALVEQTPRRLD